MKEFTFYKQIIHRAGFVCFSVFEEFPIMFVVILNLLHIPIDINFGEQL